MQIAKEKTLADVVNVKAYHVNDVILILINGEKPTPCHEVGIEKSLLTSEPPTFYAYFEWDNDVTCPAVVTPYSDQFAFRIGGARDEVLLHTAAGEQRVAVEKLTLSSPDEASPEFGRRPSISLTETTGYSKGFELKEALQDAIAALPKPPQIPDWLATYEVLSIKVEIGGIAGFNHLAVRVRG